MDITKSVVTYELGMKLKAAGIKQDSLFYWCHPEDSPEPVLMNFSIIDYKHDPTSAAHLSEKECSAFLLHELAALMPGKYENILAVAQKVLTGNIA